MITALTPGRSSTSRRNRAVALSPKQAESLSSLPPAIPAFTTVTGRRSATSRSASSSVNLESASGVAPTPSTSESPKATTARSASPLRGDTSTPDRKYQALVDCVNASAPMSRRWSPRARYDVAVVNRWKVAGPVGSVNRSVIASLSSGDVSIATASLTTSPPGGTTTAAAPRNVTSRMVSGHTRAPPPDLPTVAPATFSDLDP